ncbi:hypothetical protein F511_25366 [Dorcoceras hygrometricum]|uniref:Uncharacterized protein n=1 Tax=Dorcoceras hygrometricum TaxID=472368 RepID=A0A2Z7A3E7_9LAMI|nr:hypothetical protein F511_25366 [Dorcoceras hygrometricum]
MSEQGLMLIRARLLHCRFFSRAGRAFCAQVKFPHEETYLGWILVDMPLSSGNIPDLSTSHRANTRSHGRKKKQGYGYHDRSPSIEKNLSKPLRESSRDFPILVA